MRAILLAGGTGSRLNRLTRITNKHLLPIFDRSMVEWAVEALVAGGVDELLLVTGGERVGDFMRMLGDGSAYGLNELAYAVQERPGGIAEALGLGERFAKGGPIVVMLADNIFERSFRATIEAFRENPLGCRLVLSEMEDPTHLSHLGVPQMDEQGAIVTIVEKPVTPPSNFAVTGVYCYDARVFDVIKTLEPSGRGELEITDVNNHFIGIGEVGYDIHPGFWGDAGESIDAYQSVGEFVARNGANKP
ncbi:MAG: sugar phosphate nucleotidyltransferase [Actinomycetes bacterium]